MTGIPYRFIGCFFHDDWIQADWRVAPSVAQNLRSMFTSVCHNAARSGSRKFCFPLAPLRFVGFRTHEKVATAPAEHPPACTDTVVTSGERLVLGSQAPDQMPYEVPVKPNRWHPIV